MMKFLRKNIGYPAVSGLVPNGLNNDFYSDRYFKNTELANKYLNEYKKINDIENELPRPKNLLKIKKEFLKK